MTPLITPYLPNEAVLAIKDWQSSGKPAFQMVVDQKDKARCKNCGDLGHVIVKLIEEGPYRSPPGILSKPITWFDGDGRNGKGWYIVSKTMQYRCPECKGDPEYNRPISIDRKLSVQEDIGYLSGKLKV